MLHDEFKNTCLTLEKQVSLKMSNKKLSKSKSANKYNSLTNEYLDYLNNLEIELINSVEKEDTNIFDEEFKKKEFTNKFFFSGNSYSEKANEYITKTIKYKNSILNLVNDSFLTEKINRNLDTSDGLNRYAEVIKFMDYKYKDMPLVSVLTYLKSMKKNILQFEIEFLNNLLIKKQITYHQQ